MLAGDPQGGAILHQANIMNVRHFGTADTLVDPAHHVTQDALRIVIQFLLDLLGTQFGIPEQGQSQHVDLCSPEDAA